MRKLKEKIKEKWALILGLSIALALIILGAILKQHSPALVGEILAPIGIVIGLYMLSRDQQRDTIENQGDVIKNQENMIKNQETMAKNPGEMVSILGEIRDILGKK